MCIPPHLYDLTYIVLSPDSSTHINKITTTCLNCTSSTAIPAPPIKLPQSTQTTAEASSSSLISPPPPPPPPPGLDGPRRSARRRKAARNPSFWQREARPQSQSIIQEQSGQSQQTHVDSGGLKPDRKRKQKGGHSVWVEGQLQERWGVAVL
jgi:hypothetical protein